MRDSAIYNMCTLHPTAYSFHTAVNFGNHAAGNDSLFFQLWNSRNLHNWNNRIFIIFVPQQATDIRHQNEFLRMQTSCNLRRRNICIDVVNFSMTAARNGGNYRHISIFFCITDNRRIHFRNLPDKTQIFLGNHFFGADHITIQSTKPNCAPIVCFIKRVIDTQSLITRLYAYGKDGMTFASINGGKEYVEDTTYTNEIRVSTLDCSNFTNPYQMLEYAEMRLADYAAPRISYVLNAMDLSVLTGYEHESWKLGDIVTVRDDELNISVKTRIVRREYNLLEPWNTVLELSTTLRELGDSSSQWDAAADMLSGADLVDSQEMKDLVPFNHLKNSRADSGLNYWENSGFEVDSENGVSGTASFKCEGALNTTKSLAQTVTPANRDSYTFSCQIASEDLKMGDNGQVGVEVTFEYEDGTTETRFIDLI